MRRQLGRECYETSLYETRGWRREILSVSFGNSLARGANRKSTRSRVYKHVERFTTRVWKQSPATRGPTALPIMASESSSFCQSQTRAQWRHHSLNVCCDILVFIRERELQRRRDASDACAAHFSSFRQQNKRFVFANS